MINWKRNSLQKCVLIQVGYTNDVPQNTKKSDPVAHIA